MHGLENPESENLVPIVCFTGGVGCVKNRHLALYRFLRWRNTYEKVFCTGMHEARDGWIGALEVVWIKRHAFDTRAHCERGGTQA